MTIEEKILEQGTILDKQQVLLRLLEKKFGSLDELHRNKVLGNMNRERLDEAIDLILDAESITEVMRPIHRK